MRIVDSILAELDRETETTRRVLERVPDEKLTWKPHTRSMSLGQLAQHVATIPGGVANIVSRSEFVVPEFNNFPSAEKASELVPALGRSVADAKAILSDLDDAAMLATWKLTRDGNEILSLPRAAVVRSIMLNHWYHHRGQLSVYLRLLDVTLPSIYGPSADENPFA